MCYEYDGDGTGTFRGFVNVLKIYAVIGCVAAAAHYFW